MLWTITDTHFDALICQNWWEWGNSQDTVIHLVEEVIRSAGGSVSGNTVS